MKVLKHCILKTSVFFTLFLAASVTSNAQNRKIGINTVVIDAGHGGPDAGAVGRLYKEKDINLDVALRFGRMISEHYPDVQVIYTRKTDVLIPLAERGDIANRAKADLFISIHINSNKSSSPSGVSVYVMGVDKASKNMDVAMKENDVITYEEDYSTRYQGYKPGSTESLIMFSLMQYAYQTQSCLLADMVQKQFVGNTQMQDRGVRQAGFLVLWRAAMPSILCEFGFISNPTEEKFIGSKKGRETYARSLFNAFSQYKVRSEGRGTLIVLDSENPGGSGNEDRDAVSGATSRQEESGQADKRGAGRIPGADRQLVAQAAQKLLVVRPVPGRGKGNGHKKPVQILRRRGGFLQRSPIFTVRSPPPRQRSVSRSVPGKRADPNGRGPALGTIGRTTAERTLNSQNRTA